MQIAFEGVSPDDGLMVAVLLEDAMQVAGGLRQFRHGKCYILDDHCGSRLTHRSHGGEDAFANVPQFGVLRRILGELDCTQLRDRLQRCLDCGDLLLQLTGIGGAGVDQ